MLRNKAFFKKCVGDEAGSAPKKGFINSNTRGKTYFKSWSLNVKVEAKNVVRHLDITTSNHRSEVANESVTIPEQESSSPPASRDKCVLTTYDPSDCPEGESPHHLVPDSLFKTPNREGGFVPGVNASSRNQFYNRGLCICLEGQDKSATVSDDSIREMGLNPNDIPMGADGVRRLNQQLLNSTRQATGRIASMFPGWAGPSPLALTRGEHGLFHQQHDNIMQAIGATKPPPCTHTATFGEHRDTAASLCARKYGCDEEAIKRQLDEHYAENGVNDGTVMRSSDRGLSQPVDSSVLGNVPNNPCS